LTPCLNIIDFSMKIQYRLFIIALFAITSCSKNNPSADPTPTGATGAVDVYVAGYSRNANNKYIATYWKNDVLNLLGSIESDARGIVVKGSDVYIVGRLKANNGIYVATYWKNGTPIKLADSIVNSTATGIVLVGSDIHISGIKSEVPSKAMYWKNSVSQTLSDNTNGATANAIAANGTDIYLAGSKYTGQPGPIPFTAATYWKNGVATTLPGTATTVWDIAISDNNIYMVGTEDPGSNNYGKDIPWKNGVAGTISPQTIFPQTYAVALQGNDVYFAGVSFQPVGILYNSLPTYWKNGSPVILGNQTEADIYDIALNGNDVYVCGQNLQGSIEQATYWKNGVATTLSTNRSRLYSIALAPR
jgi:hypothetical protein